MSVKKFLVLTAAGIATTIGATAAFAGGPDQMAMPAPVFMPNIYVEVEAGYADVGWDRYTLSPFTTTGSNDTGGFTVGATVGYQFLRNFGVELGWFYLPRVRGDVSTTKGILIQSGSLRVSSGIPYFAGRLTVPLTENLDIFGKLGVTYRYLSWSGSGAGAINFDKSKGYWAPIFAGGVQYRFTPNWYVDAKFIHVPSHDSGSFPSPRNAPAVNMYVAGIGYSFAV